MIHTRGLMQWWSRIRRKHGGIQHYGIKNILWFFYLNIFQGFGTLCLRAEMSDYPVLVCIVWGNTDSRTWGLPGSRYIANIGLAADLTFVTVGRMTAVETLDYIFSVPWDLERYCVTSLFSWCVYLCLISSLKLQWSLCVEDPKFFVPPTQFYVFCVDLRTNSDYFPIQH
jgi:hypothetical protein